MRILIFILLSVGTLSAQIHPKDNFADIRAYFSPSGGCTDAIVTAINKASREVLVQSYYFTSHDIAQALIGAEKRGVNVAIIIDHSQIDGRYDASDEAANEGGIPIFVDAAHKIAHNKVIIIDQSTVITGSFNFTQAAEHDNAENILIISNAPGLAGQYRENWLLHLKHSEKGVPVPRPSSDPVNKTSQNTISALTAEEVALLVKKRNYLQGYIEGHLPGVATPNDLQKNSAIQQIMLLNKQINAAQ